MELRQLVDAYSMISKNAAAKNFENLWMPGPDGKNYTVKEAYEKLWILRFFRRPVELMIFTAR